MEQQLIDLFGDVIPASAEQESQQKVLNQKVMDFAQELSRTVQHREGLTVIFLQLDTLRKTAQKAIVDTEYTAFTSSLTEDAKTEKMKSLVDSIYKSQGESG